MEIKFGKLDQIYRSLSKEKTEKGFFQQISSYGKELYADISFRETLEKELKELNKDNENEAELVHQNIKRSINFVIKDLTSKLQDKKLKIYGIKKLLSHDSKIASNKSLNTLEILEGRYKNLLQIMGLINAKGYTKHIENYFLTKVIDVLSIEQPIGLNYIKPSFARIKLLRTNNTQEQLWLSYKNIIATYLFFENLIDLSDIEFNARDMDKSMLATEALKIKNEVSDKRSFFDRNTLQTNIDNLHIFIKQTYGFDVLDSSSFDSNELVYKDIILNVSTKTIKIGQGPVRNIDIEKDEVKFLILLMQTPGYIFSHEELARNINPSWYNSDTTKATMRENNKVFKRNLGRYISKIGTKKEGEKVKFRIKNVKGLGYRLV